ncbi:hypothetical protein ACHHYP_03023 [Achlya hypogyna]|uniref:Protein kinase domain-containing protein n=1 Tax=Achlya hypogyna TaxID=1202772 RepID=A0A1V9Z4W9_ACHHY|nr:hypothetical protein ACHHYP_03023 [Achlya hypogyna]
MAKHRRRKRPGDMRSCTDSFLKQCAAGNMTLLQCPLDVRALEAERDDDGNNGFLLAASCGHLALLQGLLAQGFNPHVVNSGGDNALHLAAFQGHSAVVQWLENQGVEISVETAVDGDLDGWGRVAMISLYFDLVKTGDVRGLRELVANVGQAVFPWLAHNDDNTNALGAAAEANQLEMLLFLVSASGLALDDSVNNRRDTSLHVAAMHGHTALVRELAPLVNLGARNAQKWTPLGTACFYGQAPVVLHLLNTFPDTCALDVAHAALVLEGGSADAPALLEQLLSRDPALLRARHGPSQETLLHIAASLRQRQVCQILLAFGANAALLDGNGWSAWHVVLHTQWRDSVDIFLTPPVLATSATWTTFAVAHASTPMLVAIYERLSSPHTLYHAAVSAQRRDVVAAIDALHEAQASAMLSQLAVAPANSSTCPPSVVSDQPPPPTTAPELLPSMDARSEAPSSPSDDPALVLQYALAAGLSAGEHDEWGSVLVASLPQQEAAATRRFYQQLLRIETPPASIVRFLSCIEGDGDRMALLFEPAGVPSSLASRRPHTAAWAALDGSVFAGVVDALAYLHDHGFSHGALAPDVVFVDDAASKLYVPPLGSCASVVSVYSAPEVNTRGDYNALAADVFGLGQTLATLVPAPLSIEGRDLLEAMTALDPEQRPDMRRVRRHPWLWPPRTKLLYLEQVANHVALDRIPAQPWAWQAALPGSVRMYLSAHRGYSDSTADLVRWVRNFKQHSREHPSHVWTALQASSGQRYDLTTLRGQERCLGAFVARAFPSLVLDLWNAVGPVE